MSAKRFTLLVIPEGSHRVRRFTLPRRWISLAISCSVLLFLGTSALLFDYVRTHVDRQELQRLRTENRSQQQEIGRLYANIEDLRKEMVVLAQNDAKVRVLAQLSGPRPDALNGMGGAPEDDAATEFSELQRQIDQIREAIELRRESQEEVQGFLNDQRSLMAAKPNGWPVKGWVTSNFGIRNSPFTGKRKMHEGLDIAASTGTTVIATADGIVSRAETAPGYGKMVVIDHGYGFKTLYGHNSKLFVKVGQRVKRGDKIAAVGNTGTSTGTHLHYEVRLNGVPLNPKKYI
ncbi:MAG: peptidoglycan DD-metalloendopeptidase family protein [Desulfuromonadales bacterium]|nr:peptidoglycan DD-metalloendopeptidase family protein [Desulfuromonadales bacterium]MDW7756204.1 peptidoglycan DD-metalloendopeptidase family protein [Desulfuromonadales bacterium]